MDILHTTVRAIEAANRPDAPQVDLNNLGQLFDQMKRSEPRDVATLASQLAGESMPLEVQHFGLKLLQHLVMLRWQDFSQEERNQLASMIFTLFKTTGNTLHTWVVRNKGALLMSLISKRMGQAFWEQLLPELLSYSNAGPIQAEKVCMILRLISEEVTWTNEASGNSDPPEWRRALLSTLVATLDTALPYLRSCLESHYLCAQQASERGDSTTSKAHSSVVVAALAALGEFGEWAPVGRLQSHQIISACGFLTAQSQYRMEGCAVLRRIGSRKQGQEDPEVFHAAMRETGEALLRAAEWVLTPSNSTKLGFGEELEEYAQYVCGSMGLWGCIHTNTLPVDRRNVFLHLAIQFTQNEYVQLAHKALPLWITLLSAAERAQRGQRDAFPLPLDCAAALMDIAGEKMRTGVHLVEETAEVPDFFESFEDYRNFLLEYRELLSAIVRLTAALLPEHALEAAARRLQQAIQVCSTSNEASEEQQINFEAMCYFVDSVVHNVSQTYLPGGKRQPGMVVTCDPHTVSSIVEKQEAMFRLLLPLHFHDPSMLTYLAKLMEAFARLLAIQRSLAAVAIEKVFDMFNDLEMEGGPWHLPANPPPYWKDRFQARSKIPGILVTYAKFAPEAMRPHVEALAATTDEKWRCKSISPGERALLCDMMIASACSADLSFQQGVVEHVLRGTQEEWTSQAWQETLATPSKMIARYCFLILRGDGSFEVGGGFDRWMLCHHLQLLERAVKRLPASANSAAPDPMSQSSPSWHVLNSHLSWILPSILQLILNLHHLSTPQGLEMLQGAAPAMQMGARERAVYLRQLSSAKQSGNAGVKEEEEATLAGSNVAALRSWVRQTREAVYQTLGYLVRNVGGFYACRDLQSQWLAATATNLEHLHSSHVRMLIRHVFIPLVKSCPPESRKVWLMPALEGLLPHVHQRLTTGWDRVLKNSGRSGAAAAQLGANTREGSSAANEEIIAERLLRELLAEHLILLRGTQDTVGENGGQQQSVLELSWKEYPAAAMAACMTAVATLWWPDENVGKASNYLRGVVAVAGRQMLDESAGRSLIRGTVQAIANGIASCQGEVLSLTRDILVIQPPIQGSREVLLELPQVQQPLIDSFDQQLMSTNSEKEQRQIIKGLLANSGLEELAVALSDWRPQNHLSNMSEPRPRPLRQPNADEDGSIMGLAAASVL